jgi:GTP-binding protein HflX
MPIRPEDVDRFARERAYLVGIDWGRGATLAPEESLAELEHLVRAAGAEVVGGVIARRRKPEAALLLGRGKAEEVAAEATEAEANLVVFDEPLTPAQQRNLEEKLDLRVIDRPTVILDIFAQRARTNEGRLQVELAQLEYELPRLRGWGGELSRTAGGIGTRGPGETKLEIDRRRVMRRIATLKKKLKGISRRRSLERAGREALPLVALVGYTNSGKTTLLNRLAGAEAYAADVPFATLDPFVKRVSLPSGRVVLFADTVGLIANLPPDLVTAFRATLEEIKLADLILVLRDVTDADVEGRAEIVEGLLTEPRRRSTSPATANGASSGRWRFRLPRAKGVSGCSLRWKISWLRRRSAWWRSCPPARCWPRYMIKAGFWRGATTTAASGS